MCKNVLIINKTDLEEENNWRKDKSKNCLLFHACNIYEY